jgi:hypothetical protein
MKQAIGTATRVTIWQAKREFNRGGIVLVSEHGHEATRLVYPHTVTHSRDTSDWNALAADVSMWRNRYPNQRYYTVSYH